MKIKLIILLIMLFFVSFPFISGASSGNMVKDELIYTINEYIKKAEVLDEDSDNRYTYFKRASKLAEDIIKKYPNDDTGYAYLAYTLGSTMEQAPFYEKIELAKKVEKAAEKAIEINENNHMALFILGMINKEASEIEGFQKTLAKQFLNDIIKNASFKRAIEYFEKAVNLDKNNAQYLYEMAKTYEEIDKIERAKNIYRKLLNLEITNKKEQKYVERARKRIDKLEKFSLLYE
ncbi:MAG: tetratricopeptide repeat protein [Deferribacterota bacterium]|nr:tetratricopeptide repeat protein [Deferribacterota bacterium]